MTPALSRRGFLGLAGAGAAVAGAGVVAGRASEPSVAPVAASTVAFRGAHQAGIATPAQDRLHFAAFDVLTTDRAELADLLRRWTDAAERMTRGQEAEPDGATGAGEYRPPTDTGEALDLDACYAYSDSSNDLPMLSLVGHPCAVNPDSTLRAHAKANGWRVRDYRTGRKVAMAGGKGFVAAIAAGATWHTLRTKIRRTP